MNRCEGGSQRADISGIKRHPAIKRRLRTLCQRASLGRLIVLIELPGKISQQPNFLGVGLAEAGGHSRRLPCSYDGGVNIMPMKLDIGEGSECKRCGVVQTTAISGIGCAILAGRKRSLNKLVRCIYLLPPQEHPGKLET